MGLDCVFFSSFDATNVYYLLRFRSSFSLNICFFFSTSHMIPAIKQLLLSSMKMMAENTEQFCVLGVEIPLKRFDPQANVKFYGSFCTAHK